MPSYPYMFCQYHIRCDSVEAGSRKGITRLFYVFIINYVLFLFIHK